MTHHPSIKSYGENLIILLVLVAVTIPALAQSDTNPQAKKRKELSI